MKAEQDIDAAGDEKIEEKDEELEEKEGEP